MQQRSTVHSSGNWNTETLGRSLVSELDSVLKSRLEKSWKLGLGTKYQNVVKADFFLNYNPYFTKESLFQSKSPFLRYLELERHHRDFQVEYCLVSEQELREFSCWVSELDLESCTKLAQSRNQNQNVVPTQGSLRKIFGLEKLEPVNLWFTTSLCSENIL